MNETSDLLFLFCAWMIMDLLGLLTFIKPVSRPRLWKNRINFKVFITGTYKILSFGAEITGIILLLYSFNAPWYYSRYLDMNRGIFFRYFYFKETIYLEGLLIVFLFYVYLLSLILIFLKISGIKKIHIHTALELLELILIIPIILLIFQMESVKCIQSVIPEIFCLNSGYSSGFILFLSGTTVLLINGLQMSIYSRVKRTRKNELGKEEIVESRRHIG